MNSAEIMIDICELSPHAEGGWFRRTYESTRVVKSDNGNRPCGTSILYLLKKDEVSLLHFLDSDETWYFHQGNPIELHSFADGHYEETMLGDSYGCDEVSQFTFFAGTVFGAVPRGNLDFSLVSCSVTPGFDFADFHWPDASQLMKDHPSCENLIRALSRPH